MTVATTPLSPSMTLLRGLSTATKKSAYVYHPAEHLFAAVHPDTWDEVMYERDDWRRLLLDADRDDAWRRQLPPIGHADEADWIRLMDVPTFADETMPQGRIRTWCTWSHIEQMRGALFAPNSHPGNWMGGATHTGQAPPTQRIVTRPAQATDFGIEFSMQPVPLRADPTLNHGWLRFECTWRTG